MTDHDDTPASPRSATLADLGRRIDRLEARHELIEGEVRVLAATVARVEQNQNHAVELNKLRFDALDTGLKSVSAQLVDFMRRIEAIISGETQTPAMRQGEEMVADYRSWRTDVDHQLEAQAVMNGQVRLLGRIAVLLVSSNILAIAAAVYAILK